MSSAKTVRSRIRTDHEPAGEGIALFDHDLVLRQQ